MQNFCFHFREASRKINPPSANQEPNQEVLYQHSQRCHIRQYIIYLLTQYMNVNLIYFCISVVSYKKQRLIKHVFQFFRNRNGLLILILIICNAQLVPAPVPRCSPLLFINKLPESSNLLSDANPYFPVPPCKFLF